MLFGNGAIKLAPVVAAAVASTALIAGLSVGISLEDAKRSRYDSKLEELRSELKTAKQVTNEINVIPPSGKRFIN